MLLFGKLSIKIRSPQIDSETNSRMNSLMNVASEYFIVPKLNEVGRNGYPLPVLDDVKYINPAIHLLENTVCISTDLKYNP
ncbi:hypothetical protein LSH36_234g00051 [Paralvinella palmiformis]|uniref:Lipid-binding serum glycoprotein C-terminal domain-containing protein n=1 Tax=Paralvinella palmiformis TaxID=53620 RepID=A0AAD9JLZ0_9ANNE|nr:hypothetical protein LSH36_234g00051 [Paralvinella palmiformis]